MGHLGYERVRTVQKCFYWPNYKKDHKQYITKKCKCLKDKKPNLTPRVPLQTITTTQTFELNSIEYLNVRQNTNICWL